MTPLQVMAFILLLGSLAFTVLALHEVWERFFVPAFWRRYCHRNLDATLHRIDYRGDVQWMVRSKGRSYIFGFGPTPYLAVHNFIEVRYEAQVQNIDDYVDEDAP